eukprot:2244840-Prymnesium_polylepis.1
MCSDAIFIAHTLDRPLLFVTDTLDPHWEENMTRLPYWEKDRPGDAELERADSRNPQRDYPPYQHQNLFERPALRAEVLN